MAIIRMILHGLVLLVLKQDAYYVMEKIMINVLLAIVIHI